MYTIILEDKRKLENLTLNGNNYISPKLIEDTVFENNLGKVTIINNEDGQKEIFENMTLIQNVSYDGKSSYFVLAKEVVVDDETVDPPESYLMERIMTLEKEVEELRALVLDTGQK